MADGGMMDMGGLGSLAGGGKGGDSGGGGMGDMSGLGADGAGMGMDGGMGGGMGDSLMAGAPGSGAMAMQSDPAVQAAAQGDPTGSQAASQAIAGGQPSAPGTAGGWSGTQSGSQPPFSTSPGQPPPPATGGALSGGLNTEGMTSPKPMAQQSPWNPSFQDRWRGDLGGLAEQQMKSGNYGQPQMPAFEPTDPNAASFSDRFNAVGPTSNSLINGQLPFGAPDSGNINTLGTGLDPFTSAVAGGEAIPDSSAVETVAANTPDQPIPGNEGAETATQDPTAATKPPTQGTDDGATPKTGATDGGKTADGGAAAPKKDGGTAAPAAAPSTGTPSSAPGGQPGGQFNPMSIIQALMRGGPMGGLLELARQVMGGSPMGGPNNAPWAPGYGPNNSFRNPQTDAQFGPRDRFGRPIGKGVPTSTSAAPAPAVAPTASAPTAPTASTDANAGADTLPKIEQGGAAGTARTGPPDLTEQTKRIGQQTRGANFMGSPTARAMGVNVRANSPEAHNAVVTSKSGMRLPVNSLAAPHFQAFIDELEARGYQINPRDSYGYANRNIRGTSTPSQHSYGNAIDINASNNPQSPTGPSNMPADVGAIAARHGLFWGGNWSPQYRDPMHFEWSGAGAANARTSSAQPNTQTAFAQPRPLPWQAPEGFDWGDNWRSSPEDLPPWQEPKTLPRGIPAPSAPTDPYSIPTEPPRLDPRGPQIG